ncbi:hypothetical protein HRI_001646500 [Hibiscus trionum]|uniref:Uncharacterized protein n=1 Tax=Hibiscus trionum TaxID=183268 RepID=A0A9W7LVZ5_HIBTR|nr:hypothetical protein HRI_001646500 [Hibiscus trionum]
MLQSCSSGELSRERLPPHILVLPNANTSVNIYSQKQNSRESRVCLEFKLQCHSRTLFSPARSSINVKKKRYGGVLPWILRSLESDNGFEKTLSSACENLNPKEQSNCERVIRVFEFFKSLKDFEPKVITGALGGSRVGFDD